MTKSLQVKDIYLQISSKNKPTHKRPNAIVKYKLSNLYFNHRGELYCQINNLRLRPYKHRPLEFSIRMSGSADLTTGKVLINGTCLETRNSEVNVSLVGYNLIAIH